MSNRLTRFTFAAILAAAMASFGMASAYAHDDDDDDDGDETSMGEDSDSSGGGDMNSSAATADSSDSGASADGGSGGGGAEYTMGVSTTFPTGGDGGAADILYGMGGENWLDLQVGLNFQKGNVVDPMGMASSETTFGIELGLGYRMYKPVKSRIRPYIEPAAFFAVTDFSNFGDTLSLGVGGLMGVDFALFDQLTLGVGVGAQLFFADSFDTIDFGLFTSSINATFWW